MKINTKLFSAFFIFAIIVTIFAYYIISEINSISYITEEIEEASSVSAAALNFNVENFHTQLEMWEYTLDPNQKRLDAFKNQRQTLDELLEDWRNEVIKEDYEHENFPGLYGSAKEDMEKISSDLKLVEQDWEVLLEAIEKFRTARDAGASDAEIKQLDFAVLQAVNDNESLFDKLEFNKEVDNFVTTQRQLIVSYEEERESKISQFMNTTYVIIMVVIMIVVILGYFISNSITTPIKKLKDGSVKLADGKFTELTISGNDELTDLTKSFNKMAGNIIQSKRIISENLFTLKKQKNSLDDVIAKLKKADLLREEFLSMVTHELKTPLTPIIFHCEMLSEAGIIGELNPEQLNSVKEIERNFTRLEKLISDLLDVQKLSMNRMRFNVKKFNLVEFFEAIKNDFFSLNRGKEIEVVIKNSVTMDLESDEFRLRQVIDNLMKNAVDFVPAENGRIEIGAKREDSKVVFYVSDNGIGITEEEKTAIFVKFYQVDTSISRKHGGTGLGLAICKDIVELLGGNIWYKSNAGRGVTFYFSIPIKQEEIKIKPHHNGRKA